MDCWDESWGAMKATLCAVIANEIRTKASLIKYATVQMLIWTHGRISILAQTATLESHPKHSKIRERISVSVSKSNFR
jgi:hypothetical protein